jgi:hypothetical protein
VTATIWLALLVAVAIVVHLEHRRSAPERMLAAQPGAIAPAPGHAARLAAARTYIADHGLEPCWPVAATAAPVTAPVTPEDARATYVAEVKAGALSRYEYARLLAFGVEGRVN